MVTAAPFTFCAWAQVPDSPADHAVFFLGSSVTALNNWNLLFHATGVLRYRITSGAATVNVDNGAFATDTWHHVAITEHASDDHRVFLDGGPPTTNAVAVTPAGVDRTTIGRQDDSTPTNAFDGFIGHGALWNVALSDAEIASLANPGVSPLRMRRDSLVAYWPLNGQSPEIDIVGRKDLTLFGAPTVAEEPPNSWSIIAPG